MDFLNNLKSKGDELLKKIAGKPISVPFQNNLDYDILKHNDFINKNNVVIPEDKNFIHHFGIDNEEGQLALDVYHTDEELIIKAPIAGVTLEDINITISDGILTIRGSRRHQENIPSHDYYLQECFWGGFSRSIVLPNNLKTEQIKAVFKNGILSISLPKEDKIKIKTIPINIMDEKKATIQ